MIELAVVLPAYQERENVMPMLKALGAALAGIEYEVIFVDDDSADGTAELVRSISLRDPKVRVLQRINRRGLASACVEGVMATAAPYIAVMDADLQHDETLLPAMLERIKAEHLDIVVGSRNVAGGSMGEFARGRVALSTMGRWLSAAVCRCQISDPMSGYFLLDRRFLMEVVHQVSAVGFKILVDLLASSGRPVRIAEVPYTFRVRQRGESKLDILVGVEYLELLVDKLVGNLIPPQFVLFGLVGAVGVVLHLAILWLGLNAFALPFAVAQAIGAVAAMTLNFFLNNSVTYRGNRLHGWSVWTGLLSFYAACSIGVLINMEIADRLRSSGLYWALAGVLGLAVGSVWNYGVTRVFTWRMNRHRARLHATSALREASPPPT